MLLQEPPESAYDLRFQLFRWPIRIAWGFWVMAIVLGYAWIQGLDRSPESPGFVPLLVLWAGAVLVSVLIHEMGHAAAFRQAGLDSEIVLYHFGGLAIPVAGRMVGRSAGRLSSRENLAIAAAGPLAQLLFAALVVVVVRVAGYDVRTLPAYVLWIPEAAGGKPILNVGMFTLVNCLVWPSIAWAVLNLIPVWPLDGGRIARELISLFGGTVRHSLIVSLVCAAGFAAWGFTGQQIYLGFLFASLAVGNWQALQSMGNWQRY